MENAVATLERLARSALLSSIRQHIDAEGVVADAVTIQQIPAPTFEEGRRAEYLADRFAAFGLENVHTDALHNVFGYWPGTAKGCPALLVSAHTDTVFPLAADLTVRREGARVFGPGLGDNSLGVAGLLAVVRALESSDTHCASDIWFVANSREEGLGDLGGIRAVWNALGPELGAALVIEGMALGRIYHAGTAVRRLRITCQAPGGHSWHHYGHASAVHGLISLGACILALTPPREPRTTYNIGLIEGGHSVNSLATSATMVLDLRSETVKQLALLESDVRGAVDGLRGPELSFEIDVVGDRPAGQIPRDHTLVQLAAAAVKAVRRQPVFEIGSTDANVLLAHDLPTVTVGISRGGHTHRLDEYIETAPVRDGIWHLILLTLAVAETLHLWSNSA